MKKAAAHKIVEKKNGRYMVKVRGGGLLKAAEKLKVLEDAGKVKKMKPKAKAEAAAEPAAT